MGAEQKRRERVKSSWEGQDACESRVLDTIRETVPVRGGALVSAHKLQQGLQVAACTWLRAGIMPSKAVLKFNEPKGKSVSASTDF